MITTLFRRLRFRTKKDVTPAEFIEALEADFRRPLDPESTFFFRNHPESVNLVHRIFNRGLRKSSAKKDDVVITTFAFQMACYTPGFTASNLNIPNPKDSLADILEAFKAVYPDAGNVIGQAVVLFLGFKE
jgi:hypothetical protein